MSDFIGDEGIVNMRASADSAREFTVRILPPDAAGETAWAWPVDIMAYPPQYWYAASLHDLTGAKNGGYKHSGIDINLEIGGRGDVERGMPIFAVTSGVVHYVTWNWSGVGMVVVDHREFYIRYAHIDPAVKPGQRVRAGDVLGVFANWKGGDHLHFDINQRPITREWLTGGGWIDPVPVLSGRLGIEEVAAFIRDDRLIEVG